MTFSVILRMIIPLFDPGKARMKQVVITQRYFGGNDEAYKENIHFYSANSFGFLLKFCPCVFLEQSLFLY